jgi:hypothetical protein
MKRRDYHLHRIAGTNNARNITKDKFRSTTEYLQYNQIDLGY